VRPRDLQVLLHSTMRYSLGRMTYMPGLVQDLIRQHYTVFHPDMLRQLADEIDSEHRLRDGKLGMDFDTKGWLDFRDWLRSTADAGVIPLSPTALSPTSQPKE
jgi:hypothetical protein